MDIDPLTGTYYDNARWYNSTNGDFFDRDPIGYAGGINLYEYCNNLPTLLTDSLGLEATIGPNPTPPTTTWIPQQNWTAWGWNWSLHGNLDSWTSKGWSWIDSVTLVNSCDKEVSVPWTFQYKYGTVMTHELLTVDDKSKGFFVRVAPSIPMRQVLSRVH